MASDLYQLYDSDLHLLPCDSFFPCFSDTNYSTVAAIADNFQQEQSSIEPLFPPDNLNLLSPPSSHLPEAGPTSTTLPLAIPTDSLSEAMSSPLFGSHSYSGGDEEDYYYNVANKFMQRSYSINSFEEKPAATALFHNHPPPLDASMESLNSPDFQAQFFNSPNDNCFFGAQIRRVCSTGDLQGSMSCPTTGVAAGAAEGSCYMDEANLKVGRYSAEERKERILKYRAKRNQRNFTKTIKYACRKTLADNRPRIRGRFARNDEIGDVPKAAGSNRDDDEDEFLWGLQEEDEYGAGAGPFCSKSYVGQQAQYHLY